MASGHVNRTYRPNTWLHRPIPQKVKKALANSEPSTHGHFGDVRVLRNVRLTDERNFPAPLVRPTRGNVRGPPLLAQRRSQTLVPAHRGLQGRRQLKTDLREIFGAAQFSTFSTISAHNWTHAPQQQHLQSIISSARPSSAGGMVSPRAVEVLTASTNLVGCSIGRSEGLAPFKILSTSFAARW
jgi:hypothetical protein